MNDKDTLPMENDIHQVFAGFPSPAENWRERPLKLQEWLSHHPDTTYYFRVRGNSMRDAGIGEGDVLVVDRAFPVEAGDIVVAALEDRHLVKRIEYVGEHNSQMLLCSAHPDYPPLFITQEMQVEIWGVVIAVVRRMRHRRGRPQKPNERT